MADTSEHRRLAAIMFTDMVGYSALTQRNEAVALELLEEHQRLLRHKRIDLEVLAGLHERTQDNGAICHAKVTEDQLH